MPSDEFWNQSPWLVTAYREADLYNRQRHSNDSWLQGLYIYNALATVVGNALSRKGTPAKEYLSEPIRVIPLTDDEKLEKAENERQKLIDYLNNLSKKAKQ